MLYRLLLLLCFILKSKLIYSAKILSVFPHISYSHHQVYKCFVDALLDQGHQVVTITTQPAYREEQMPINLTQIDVREISHNLWNEEMSKIITDDFLSCLSKTSKLFVKLMKTQFQTKNVIELIENKNITFDLMVLESRSRMALMMSDYYKVPVIEMSSFDPTIGDLENTGAPMQPLLYPQAANKRIYNLTFTEKLTELYRNYHIEKMFLDQMYPDFNEAMKSSVLNSTPSIDILQNNIHLTYVNTHPVWDTIRPVPPSVVYTFGIHLKTSKELTKDLLSYLEASVNGVRYVSFGTTAYVSQYSGKVQTLMKALSQLPYDVLFKWHEDELENKPNNVKIAKWFPQADLLKHPKVKAFITQGGKQSTDEAIGAGVPLIGIPLMWDQWANVEKYVHHGIGVKLDIEEITEEQISNAINTVINDMSFRQNIIKLRTILLDTPQSPMDRAIHWAHYYYLIRHGGAHHLRAPAVNMSNAEFFELELFLTSAIILLLFCATAFFVGAALKPKKWLLT
ncbi:UDP-glucosyltransferase 2-like [Achroia grisella]|uniref:UDP-glucosyltransferase 2-like n=1 Tax=Achroia grisella TaxID=688607 RepID=UPI0027D313AC|nr:UDP-glucosyltransferase 2-like [Achroia grisella]